MVTGYGGTYRATVVDDADPMEQQRLLVMVPEVYGEASVWAVPLRPAGPAGPPPATGDLVWVSFEHGDTDYPIWQADQEPGSGATGRYEGKYRGLVVDNDDPMQQNRLEVMVPEVNPTAAWATAPDVAGIELPAVGSDVWIEYENGDPAYPRWVGLA